SVPAAEGSRRYIVVVMGEETIPLRDKRVKELLAQAFDQFQPSVPVKAGEVIDSISIELAKEKEAEIVPV
ncbi:MAG TPA: hypothetical protein DEA85_03570, partial [Firmicutes bacterium]|nr:hypothetical protein [Bacillota bacterium]